MTKPKQWREKGSVSLFVVIFSALLITTITVAFVQIMIQNQQQATANDLSKSALDSAQAGVEDAKRVIVAYQTRCLVTGMSADPDCMRLAAALSRGACSTIQEAQIAGSPGDPEVKIEQGPNDAKLDQAYTCVKINLDTDNYLGSLTRNTSLTIPLISDGFIDQVTIGWYSQKDLEKDVATGTAPSHLDLGFDTKLPKTKDWPKYRPALLRVQLLQYGDSFKLSDFNKEDGGSTNNATLFLYPTKFGAVPMNFSEDVRGSQANNLLKAVECKPAVPIAEYACTAKIHLPLPISSATTRNAFLRIEGLYGASTTSLQLTMQNTNISSDNVNFKGVQPSVDSTGRANSLFRRLKSRINLGADGSGSSGIPNVAATVDIAGSFCKAFIVTDQMGDYVDNCVDN